jgi:hypothetical protein
VSNHTLSQDLGALACTVAAVSPELADRAAALEVSRNQWRQIAQRVISANDCSLVLAEKAETLLTTERAARELAERRLAALGSRHEAILPLLRWDDHNVGWSAMRGNKVLKGNSIHDLADAIIAEQGPPPAATQDQEILDATQ